MRFPLMIAGVLGLLLASLSPAGAQDLSIDLSAREVAVTVDFAGADVVLFGAADGAGDVIVEVRGPSRAEAVRRKDRVAGIWLNRETMVFDGVPAFYAIAGSRPLPDILTPAARAEAGIGVEHLGLVAPQGVAPAEAEAFRKALIRNNQAAGLFPREAGEVVFPGGRLFRTDIRFPANAAVGPYEVTVHLVRDGRAVDTTRTQLTLSRVGFEAGMYDLAFDHASLYGGLAIIVAVMAGWLANLFFRSRKA